MALRIFFLFQFNIFLNTKIHPPNAQIPQAESRGAVPRKLPLGVNRQITL